MINRPKRVPEKQDQKQDREQDPISEITAHAHQEINWVRGAYKFAAGIIGVIVVFGIFFTYQSARDFKNELKQDGLDEQQRVNKEVDILKQKVMQDMQTEALSVRQEVVKRINDEFASSNIVALGPVNTNS